MLYIGNVIIISMLYIKSILWGTLGVLMFVVVVVKGLFARVRNPAYIGVVTLIAGEAVVLQSFWIIVQAAVMWVVFHLFVTLWEEPDLRTRFGRPYVEYCKKVPRWLPRL